MLKIGDFSRLGQVSVRMLRHYDDLGLLKPAHIDQFTDYRYYTIDQLPRLNRILMLKDLGLTLEQIANLLQKDLPLEQLQDLLQAKQADLHQQLQDTKARLNRISARLEQLEKEGRSSDYDVIIKSAPACCIASTRYTVPSAAEMPKYRGILIRQLYAWLKQQHIMPSGYEIVLYHISEYTETDIDMEFGIAVPESTQLMEDATHAGISLRHLAPTQIASVVHSGMLRDVTQAIAALLVWIGTNDYTSSGAIREIHLFGPETQRVRDEPVVVELQIPIEPF